VEREVQVERLIEVEVEREVEEIVQIEREVGVRHEEVSMLQIDRQEAGNAISE
jgi:hypothetical protein